MVRYCSVVDCELVHYGHGFCQKHYSRWRTHGDPFIVKSPPGRVPGTRNAATIASGICVKCGNVKEFNGRSWCKRCKRIYNKEYYEINHDALLAQKKKAYVYDEQKWGYNIKRLYNITTEDYYNLLVAQDGVCAICGTSSPGKRTSRFVVDHDHSCCPDNKSCGKCIRGLLCTNCNHLLGNASDSVETLQRSIRYLESR